MQLTQDYFELFELPCAFDIDFDTLSEQYRKLQRKYHPDKFVNGTDQERRVSIQKTAFVNEAYQTLKSPMRRARYLLTLGGVEFDDEKETHFDPAFLMEQMELRESLSELRTADNATTELIQLIDGIARRKKELETQLAAALKTQGKEQDAKQLVQKMQFLIRLQQDADELEEELLDSF
jgi:molecular chaperone HscB